MGFLCKDGGDTQRFLDVLNTPVAVFAVLVVVVAANAFLYFGYYSLAVQTAPPAKTAPLPGERTGLLTVPKGTGAVEKENRRPQEPTLETTANRGAATTSTSSAP